MVFDYQNATVMKKARHYLSANLSLKSLWLSYLHCESWVKLNTKSKESHEYDYYSKIRLNYRCSSPQIAKLSLKLIQLTNPYTSLAYSKKAVLEEAILSNERQIETVMLSLQMGHCAAFSLGNGHVMVPHVAECRGICKVALSLIRAHNLSDWVSQLHRKIGFLWYFPILQYKISEPVNC